MPDPRPHQLNLLARIERETQPGAALSAHQQQELVKMLAELLLQAARLANGSSEEGNDE
jgi:hypothetical protein